MSKRIIRLMVSMAIGCLIASTALSQGRGRGIGVMRKSDVFINSHDARQGRLDGRGRNLDWKCGRFVNCHDARNGRWDGRGPRLNRGRYRSGVVFVPRSSRVRYQFGRTFVRNGSRRSDRLNRIEMLRQERIAERRRFARP